LATRRALHSIFPSCSPRSRDHRALHSFPTRRSSDLDREANLDLYVERTVALWRFVHPSVQAALELGYDEFQDRMEAGFAASPAEFAEVLRMVTGERDRERLAALVRAVQRLPLGTVVARDFDPHAAAAALRAM